jgi:DNA-binding NarL/FixJ family response regulator
MTNIGIIEDNIFQLNCYLEFFKSLPELNVVWSFRSIEDIKNYPAKNNTEMPDLVLLDFNLPGVSGIEAIEFIKSKFEGCKVITLTAQNESKNVIAALLAGSSGYILKSPNFMELYNAINEVRNNGAIFSSKAALHLVDYIKTAPEKKAFKQLTKRELEMIALVKGGLSYKDMAQKLCLSVHTVNYHLKNIYEKMEVKSKSELISKIYSSE